MKNKNALWAVVAVLAVAVVGTAVYFGNTQTQKGSMFSLFSSSNNQNQPFFTLTSPVNKATFDYGDKIHFAWAPYNLPKGTTYQLEYTCANDTFPPSEQDWWWKDTAIDPPYTATKFTIKAIKGSYPDFWSSPTNRRKDAGTDKDLYCKWYVAGPAPVGHGSIISNTQTFKIKKL